VVSGQRSQGDVLRRRTQRGGATFATRAERLATGARSAPTAPTRCRRSASTVRSQTMSLQIAPRTLVYDVEQVPTQQLLRWCQKQLID
jgi:hypothetical protein